VHLLGLRSDVERVLCAGDVFAQPSRNEGLPLALLEAMAAGLPVVVTRVGGMAEVVREGESGHLVAAGDAAALSAALAALLGRPDRGRELGAAGRARVQAEYSVERMAARYRALYGARARGTPAASPAARAARWEPRP
jgi:glycosyltransferase involved in cell wall biosynthesis